MNKPPSSWRHHATILGASLLFMLVVWLMVLTVPRIARWCCGYAGLPR